MSLGELVAVLTVRNGFYALVVIGLLAVLAFMFSITTFFGGITP